MRPLFKLPALIALLLIVPALLRAQVTLRPAEESPKPAGIHGVPGSDLLLKQEAALREYVRQHPEAIIQKGLRKTTAWNFNVGDAHSWYAYDYSTSTNYLVPATCRAVGTNCYIFVEDAIWGTRATQPAVDSVRTVFDLRTPANTAKGVFQMDVDTFGAPPDVDNDAKIIILILDIKDSFAGTGSFVEGYFYSLNELNVAQSNHAEIYYLDANPTNLASTSGLQEAMSVTAHEFQHMIHWNHDPSEISFINEGCSLAAEVICGYPIYSPSYYVNETNHYLLDWRGTTNDGLKDYSRAARFMTYIRDQIGAGVFLPIVATTLTGISGLDAGFASFGTSRRFSDIFQDWLVANILDDTTVSPRYGYRYPGLPKAVGIQYLNPNVPSTSESLDRLSARYLSFKGGAHLQIAFTLSDPSLVVKAVEIGPGSKRVLDVVSGSLFSEPAFGSTYTEIEFVVMNTSQTFSYSYTYVASGTGGTSAELKWDNSEPTGYYALSAADTVCVTFDAVPGAKLDSIRVALRRAGTITGGVWQYTGVTRPTPLGAPLAVPVSATIATTPGVPYPVPWNNWSTVDLRSYNINANTPFAVGFVYAGTNITDPRVMSTEYPSTDPFHSFTYLQVVDNVTTPNWYYLTTTSLGDTLVSIYLIRAYVSFGSTGVGGAMELQPASFALGQNYPNPFNPSTSIRFSLARQGLVTLKVYNLLGEEVATIVNGDRKAGEQSVQWTPGNLPSGVYVYRLHAEGFVQSRKLILLK